MKRKTISKLLSKKFRDWVESIKDPRVQELVKKNTIITGGAIASMLDHEKVNDYDLYFTTKETALAVACYYVAQFNDINMRGTASVEIGQGQSLEDLDAGKGIEGLYKPHYDPERIWIHIPSRGVAGEPVAGVAGEELGDTVEEFEAGEETTVDTRNKYQPVFLSQNAITLSDKIQLIIRFYGDATEIHKNFDFVHCTNYWESKTGKTIFKHQALEALLTKELVYVGSKYPVCSLIRTRKFIKRGYSITAGTYLKMILQCNELDLFDLDVLEDQLTGVDSAYFMMMISAVRTNNPDKLNASYLCEIIDRIF